MKNAIRLLVLSITAFLLTTFVSAQAQPPDSLLLGTILVGNIVSLNYSEADLQCALENVIGNGADISTVSIEPFDCGWGLLGSGTVSTNGVDVAFGLVQHDQQLFLRAAAQWDRCDGVNCSSCKPLVDNEGDVYCECKKKVTPSGFCNHSTGTGGAPSLLIGAVLTCAS